MPVPSSRLTAFSFFMDAKCLETREAGGRPRANAVEIYDKWTNLPEDERKPWEDLAAKAQEDYLRECTQRCMAATMDEGEGADGADDDACDDDAQECGDDDGQEEAQDHQSRLFEATMMLPHSRVKRIAQGVDDSPATFSKEAVFTTAKAAEAFMERCAWAAVRMTGKESRKTISVSNLVSSLKLHPIPEVVQFFVEELQPAPPKPQPVPANAKKRKQPSSAARAPKGAKKNKST